MFTNFEKIMPWWKKLLQPNGYLETRRCFEGHTLQEMAFLLCQSLHKIWSKTGFHWPVFSRIRAESCPYTGEYGSVKTRILAYFMYWIMNLFRIFNLGSNLLNNILLGIDILRWNRITWEIDTYEVEIVKLREI